MPLERGIKTGIQQTLFKGKVSAKATFSDLFNTFHWSATSNTTGQTLLANGGWESRQFKVNFSYRFGNSKIKQGRQHKSSIEEENQRTQSGGGLGGQQQKRPSRICSTRSIGRLLAKRQGKLFLPTVAGKVVSSK